MYSVHGVFECLSEEGVVIKLKSDKTNFCPSLHSKSELIKEATEYADHTSKEEIGKMIEIVKKYN